jgi:hypothetical protein
VEFGVSLRLCAFVVFGLALESRRREETQKTSDFGERQQAAGSQGASKLAHSKAAGRLAQK